VREEPATTGWDQLRYVRNVPGHSDGLAGLGMLDEIGIWVMNRFTTLGIVSDRKTIEPRLHACVNSIVRPTSHFSSEDRERDVRPACADASLLPCKRLSLRAPSFAFTFIDRFFASFSPLPVSDT